MRSETPKHLHPLLGRRLVDWVIEAARGLGAGAARRRHLARTRETRSRASRSPCRSEPRGHRRRRRGGAQAASRASRATCSSSPATPPRSRPSCSARCSRPTATPGAAATVLSFEPAEPGAYGRIVRERPTARSQAIVEARDASEEELAIREVNSSIYVFDAAKLWPALERLEPQNAQGELYLTDTVRDLVARRRARRRAHGRRPGRGRGREHARRARRGRGRPARPDQPRATCSPARRSSTRPRRGSTRPSSSSPTRRSSRSPSCAARRASRAGAEVGPHVVAVDAEIGPDALVGPFCYLRPGTVLEAGAKAGAFVEIKNSRIGEGTKVPHQSYIGDADIGADTNIGGGQHHGQLPPRAGPAERPDDDRAQRQDRRPQCVRRTRRDRRRCVDRGRLGDHRGRPARVARDRAGAAGDQGRLRADESGSRR